MSNKSNCFIYEDGDDAVSLQMTAYNVVNALAVIKTAVSANEDEPIKIDAETCWGLEVMIKGAQGALNHIASEMDNYEKKPTKATENGVQAAAGGGLT